MTKYEKRNNMIPGIIMFVLMIIYSAVDICGYIPMIVRHFATVYTWSYFIADIILLVLSIAGLIITIVRKRQDGFGVSFPLSQLLIIQIAYVVAFAINNPAGREFRIRPGMQEIFPFLLVIPIVLIIVYFFVPNLAMKIVSASVTGLTVIIYYGWKFVNLIRAINSGYFRNVRFMFSTVFGLFIMSALFVLIFVQLFLSFRSVKQVSSAGAYPRYANAPQPTQVPSPVPVSNETIIANYCNLLEKGMISQEQYDAKINELNGR